MLAISPKIAAELAEIVYLLKKPNAEGTYRLGESNELRQCFDLNLSGGPIMGRTGGFASLGKKTTGFAIVGHGKGRYEGDRVVAVRGTGSLADSITDLHCGISTSYNGSTVHAGFNQTFNDMMPLLERQLTPSLRGSGNGTVHCVGHSLGGALASIIAGWIKRKYNRPVNLYTFGSPRIGLNGYATNSTFEVANHFRCTHGSDPVPKVPVWPFEHAPNTGGGREYRLDKSQLFNPLRHRMASQKGGTPGYRDTAKGENWQQLQLSSHMNLNGPVHLSYANRHQASFSDYWANVINEGLITLLKESGEFTAVYAQGAISGTLSFYDTVARSLHQVAKASPKFAEQTRGLLGHMLVFAGYPGVKVADLSYKFIRWVFERTLGTLYRNVKQALKMLGDY